MTVKGAYPNLMENALSEIMRSGIFTIQIVLVTPGVGSAVRDPFVFTHNHNLPIDSHSAWLEVFH